MSEPNVKVKETIFIIDYSETVRDCLKRYLEQNGYNIILAQEGKEALGIYSEKKKEINLVILDIMMPIISGRKILKQLKMTNPDIKVIVMSGFLPEILDLEDKNTICLPKPIVLSELLKIISDFLDNKPIEQ